MLMRAMLRFVMLTLMACACPAAVDAQTDSTLYVVTYIEAVPASQAQVASLLGQLADASRTEGPVRFEVLQRTTESNHFLILESWKDQRTFDAHTAAAQTRRFREQLAPLLLAPVDQRLSVATTVAPARQARGAVYVVTHIDVPPVSRDAAVPVIRGFAEQSRADAGNVRFDVVQEAAKTNHMTVVAVWASEKAGEDHQVAAHTRTFRTRIAPFAGALYDQRLYKPL